MELQEVDVTIDKNGQVRIEVRGVKGPSCLEITKSLEDALGGEVVSREMTAEATESSGMQVEDQMWERSGG